MPSKKQYNLVNDDAYDSRIPLHSEEAFQHGINFHAKYIGTLDVPRPSSRVEIVAAMRRIRYEFKAKSIKKKKVTITISVDGVKVTLRKKKKKNQWPYDEHFLVMTHPIYRIFYVSHDSQDLKIFSYIARDGGSNVFKCNVFKSSKKSQAMRIVRTVGQAFEVCHKLSLTQAASSTPLPSSHGDEDIPREKILDVSSEITQKGILASSGVTEKDNASGNASDSIINISPNSRTKAEKSVIKESEKAPSFSDEAGNTSLPEGTPLGVYHQVQLLREQLEQQAQQTQSTSAQLHLLKDQLSAETAARIEAQTQNSHLLQHNKELLEHIRVLVKHIQDLENKVGSKTEMPSTAAQNVPQSLGLPDFLRMEAPAAQPSPSSHTSPSLGRSNSANYPSSSADAFLKRSGIVRSPSSVSGARVNTNPPDQSSSISQLLGGLSLPSSPTLQSSGYSNTSLSGTGTTSNFESLFQGILGNSQPSQANRNFGSTNTGESVSSYLRPPDSPGSSKLSTSPAISTASSSIFANTLASLPKLNPPPQKTRATKPLEQLSMFASSRSWTDPSQAGPLISENPSRLTTSDILTWSPQIPSSSLSRQYSPSVSRSPITNRVNTKDQDSSVSQVLRDLSKINLSDRDTNKGNNSRAADSRASTFYQS